ncbi:MAG: metalloregulator ArsR/SmtB family transcription factor [Phototrophicaceae bacterium]
MADWDFILAPATVVVDLVLDEVAIVSNSIKMLSVEEFHSGLHEWISRTAYNMTPEQRKMNDQVAGFIDHFTVAVPASNYPDFIAGIAQLPDEKVLDLALYWMRENEQYPGDEAILNDRDTYITFVEQALKEKYAKKGDHFDHERWSDEWDLLQVPHQMVEDMSAHLQFLWDTYVQAEWKRVKPLLQEAVDAFKVIDYDGMSAFDAIETITGRNMRGKDFFEERLDKAERLVFMPNAHLGPYISWGATPDESTMIFFFGARPPKNASVKSTALSRSELLVRLNALADETRLKMLEMLTESDELCAQDFITGLELSQSSASRHLRQLTASGYLSERRRDVAKCYSINPERIDDTIAALKLFLKS